MTILVTGGAGYIGAHVVRLLIERGDEVVVVDDLSSGDAARVEGARVVELDVASDAASGVIATLIRETSADAVIHFAARKQVGESMERPAWYYGQNLGGLANVVAGMADAGAQRLIFSSSAATYGMPDVDLLSEDAVCAPINPYGETKLVGEWLTRDAARAHGLRVANLRYFNVAGAGWPDLGDPTIMNVVPIIFNAISQGKQPIIFGTDYPTPDGTCIRDYVHVLDLAQAHVAALDYVARDDRSFDTFNVGTGAGSSVREVIDAVARVTGLVIDPVLGERRAGDPPRLIGDVARIHEEFGWEAKHGLDEIVESAWAAWQKRA